MIKNIERFRALIPTVTGKSLDKYTQPISDAVGWLHQIIGPALMRVITSMQDEAEAPELFKRAELVVACKAYLIAIPKMDVIETSNGFAIVNDDKLAPASRDRVSALTSSMVESLNLALGELIEYLEDCSDYRDEWTQSPAYKATSGSYIPTLRMFREYGNFEGGHLDFIAARADFVSVIVKYIEPVISCEFSAEMLNQIRNTTIDEKNIPVIGSLRLALAGYYNKDTQLGDTCVSRVRETLESRPDDFPIFRDSALYRKILDGRKKELKSTSIHVMI